MLDRPNNRKKWDEAADAELRRRVDAGELLPVMAQAMGRSQEALRTRTNLLKLPVRSTLRGAPSAQD